MAAGPDAPPAAGGATDFDRLHRRVLRPRKVQLTLTLVVANVDSVDAALKALAEPRRREIVRLVWGHELPATDIADHFGEVTRSAISQHLGVLKAAGLVIERREGTRRLYRADRAEMKKLRKSLDDYWTSGLERLRDVAEAAQRDKEKQ
jgi:DNA-binding transcriptional ArsR family regulator